MAQGCIILISLHLMPNAVIIRDIVYSISINLLPAEVIKVPH